MEFLNLLYILQLNEKHLPLTEPWVSEDGCVEVENKRGVLHLFGMKSGIKVTFISSYLNVYIDATLVNITGGLCGDHDNNRSNEFRKMDGSLTGSVNEFGISWQMKDYSNPE